MVELPHPSDSTNQSTGAATPSSSAHESLLGDAWGWTKGNIVDPLVNAAVLEPYNAIASTTNLLTGHSKSNPLISEATPLKTSEAKFLTPSWFTQEVSGGIGMVVPYVIAGKMTGGAMRYTGAKLGLEGGLATFVQDQRVAQITGAAIYGGMQDPAEGQSRLGNAASSAAAFGIFEGGNTLSQKLALRSVQEDATSGLMANSLRIGQQVGLRALTGGVAGAAQISISKGIADHQLPTGNDLIQSAVGGGVMNIALPPMQALGGKAIDGARQQLGLGTPIDRYFANNTEAKSAASQSDTLRQKVSDNRWSKVQENTSQDSASIARNLASMKEGFDPAKLGHELDHLSSNSETGFKQAANLLNSGDKNGAWDAYRNVRADQEVSARQTEAKIASELGKPAADLSNLKETIGDQYAADGKTYDQMWHDEFSKFESSNGKFRPTEDFGGMDKSLSPEDAAKESEFQKGIATKICQNLQDEGFTAVFAGGAVRDELMGKTPNDFDIATSATPEQVEKVFKDAGVTVFPKGQAFGVECVVIDGRQFEIATLRTEGEYKDGRRPDAVNFVTSLKEDAARRDLTINAMFKDPVSGKIYDYFGGQDDINNKVIRSVGDPNARFAEDKLRMMRVPRFYSKLDGFTVDPDLLDAIRTHAPDISSVSGERLRDEMSGILTSPEPNRGLQMMMDTGLMHQILPEVSDMDGPKGMQDPGWHPEGTAWTHTKMVLDGLKGSSFEMMMAGLLHDIGKPRTQVFEPDGGITNHKHDSVGADMSVDIANRFKLTNKQTEQIQQLVKLHMAMHHVQELRPSRLRDLLSRPDINDLIDLEHADALGRSPGGRTEGSQKEFLQQKLAEFKAAPETQRLGAKPLIDGDVLRELDFKPGPLFRPILESAQQAQQDGQFATAEEGRKFVLENFGQFQGVPYRDQDALLAAQQATQTTTTGG